MGATYFFGFTIGCLKGGELVKRVGHVRVFLAMSAIASAAPLIHGLVVQPLAWGLLRWLSGFCFSVLYIVIESWLNDRATNENRGAIFSIYAMIMMTGLATGQMMNLMYDPSGLELFIIASVLVSIGGVPVALSTSPSPSPEQPHAVRSRFRWSVTYVWPRCDYPVIRNRVATTQWCPRSSPECPSNSTSSYSSKSS